MSAIEGTLRQHSDGRELARCCRQAHRAGEDPCLSALVSVLVLNKPPATTILNVPLLPPTYLCRSDASDNHRDFFCRYK